MIMSLLYFSYFQDILKNDEYTLLLQNDSSDVTYFSDADMKTNREEALIWQKIKDNPNSFAESLESAEKMVLENPFYVYFGSYIISLEFKNIPCLIEASAKIPSMVCLCFLTRSLLNYFYITTFPAP